MNSYLHIKSFLGQVSTIELLEGWSPMSWKAKVKKIKNWLKNQSILSVDQKKKLEMTPDLEKKVPVVSTSSRTPQRQPQETSEQGERFQKQKKQVKRQSKLAKTLPTRVKDSQIEAFSHGKYV
ncbi:hypothetical protein O181_009547 [Austropuccinia psidii MF-1]|uniref:Uncharacterized protein n=1 Tax=Austropuccinia psidii MF-1 TaxID=1389203 RepID=A0A9Q3BRZ5_9BASI|nr:hypothetical protein [Austropuccinia psidii MF-1]